MLGVDWCYEVFPLLSFVCSFVFVFPMKPCGQLSFFFFRLPKGAIFFFAYTHAVIPVPPDFPGYRPGIAFFVTFL